MADIPSNLSVMMERADSITASLSKLPEIFRSNTTAIDSLEKALNRLADKIGNHGSDDLSSSSSSEKVSGKSKVGKTERLKNQMGQSKEQIEGITGAAVKLHHQYGLIASVQGNLGSLGIDDAGIQFITQEAKDFSNTWSGTSQSDFLQTSYRIKDGIAGLSDEAVAGFSRISTLTAGATNTSAEQMTQLFTQAYHTHRQQFEQFGTSTVRGWEKLSAAERDIKFGEYLSQGISASVQMLSANGEKMHGALSALGASATQANVPFAEQLAILSELQKSGSSGEAAGKQYASFVDNSSRIGEALKLESSGEGPISTTEIIAQLRGKYGDSLEQNEQAELLNALGSKMGGPSSSAANDSLSVIKALLSGGDNVAANTEKMQTALQQGMSVTVKMAGDNLKGPNESLMLMQQRFTNLAVVLGESLAPVVMLFADLLGQGAMMVADLAERFPVLTQFLLGGVMVFAALKTAMLGAHAVQLGYNLLMGSTTTNAGRLSSFLSGLALRTRGMALAQGLLNAATVTGRGAQLKYLYTLSYLRVSIPAMLGSMRKLLSFTRLATFAQRALNLVMRANPIGLIIGAIGLLIPIVTVLIDKFGALGSWFGSFFGGDDEKEVNISKKTKVEQVQSSVNDAGADHAAIAQASGASSKALSVNPVTFDYIPDATALTDQHGTNFTAAHTNLAYPAVGQHAAANAQSYYPVATDVHSALASKGADYPVVNQPPVVANTQSLYPVAASIHPTVAEKGSDYPRIAGLETVGTYSGMGYPVVNQPQVINDTQSLYPVAADVHSALASKGADYPVVNQPPVVANTQSMYPVANSIHPAMAEKELGYPMAVGLDISGGQSGIGYPATTGIQPVATGLSANTAGPSTYSSNYQIHIQQQPGEQGEDVAQRVHQELERRERERARYGRAVLYDQ
ncbi:phage tail tape measure protein [Veronia pacifica]|uniref:Phage tail tape measure protein domain-containing protein n=1 Tax=Veronia pacifica TaxID=1080227 RepID=A0A1C3EBL4_9GAMM|nr:phage tail tape measure protein [Veronia pacifica]ODA30632.1 hypothetical protein A8L45_19705 [Veronia pacifica]